MHHKHKAYLKKADPVMEKLIAKINLPPLKPHTNHFKALVHSIISQQLSDKAATTIFNRFIKLFPKNKFPTPAQVFKISQKKIRTAGLSGAKAEFLKHLAKAFFDKTLTPAQLKHLEDEAVIHQLIQIKGIGRWTAEMFLIFALGREDVFSPGDKGLQNAIARWYKVRDPSAKNLRKLAQRWQPYRTYACRYLWASLNLK